MHTKLGRLSRGIVGIALMFLSAGAWAQDLTLEWTNDPGMQAWASTYNPGYSVDWQNGLGTGNTVQANPGDITVVDDPVIPGRKVVRANISRTEDFSLVANGSPRAEVLFPPSVQFALAHDYLIRWSTYLPVDFAFDSKQLVIITQIHQGQASGSPTIALTLLGQQYAISERGGSNAAVVSGAQWLCCADKDRGKWVNWTLHYVPDDSGQHAVTELYKDGISVFATRGVTNAYPNDQSAYLKIGLYKPGWISQPSDVSQITVYFGPVYVSQR